MMFSFFSRKKNILQTGLLEGMADLHCHLLPGVDDGVQTEEEAATALRALSEMGVTSFYLTPHVMEDLPLNNRSFLEEAFGKWQAALPPGIRVKLAAEYMLDAAFASHLADGYLTIGNDRLVLVETSYLSPPPDLDGMLYDLTVNGYTPLIAHPERYVYMEREKYVSLKNYGYKFQLNLLSLAGFYGRLPLEKSRYLLKNGLYDYAGSDFHNLDKHRRGLAHLSLHASERKELRVLLDHNNEIFYK
ncbi:CpsB/CapC family capsule biosynthesis tyrosine phosphatase [uncultured Parabacteroides sp.]|uniref:tyrosine-protein phosphatase n=1 Tax=uncultured Parabacteroides sp. TaxID=512312 RepID=UPI00280413DD|nr:CpsB/CapC family capsule biosynthesis tyrosine phosphatase [uncultured Parabacteroides sp.]